MAETRAYHHGNLKESLLEAARELLADTGPKGLTLRELARKAGVSHNAPYRHFKDKDELLGAVADQGFEELTRSMLHAARKGETSLERIREVGLAYIDFALRRPEHFTVMFDVHAHSGGDAGPRSFQTLVGFIEDCQRDGHYPEGDPIPLAYGAWSLVHGISKLALAGRFPGWSRAQIRSFAAGALDSSIRGVTCGK